MSVVKIDGHAPCKGRARNAKILHAGLDEVVDHFLFARFGINKVGVRLYVILKAFLILGQL